MTDPRPNLDVWLRGVLETHERPLLAYAARVTRDHEIARDVVQDVFVKLCEHERRQPGGLDGHLAPWLYRVCRNRALDVRRKDDRMTSLTDERLAATTGTGDGPLADQRDETRDVFAALDGLSDKQQNVLRLKFQSGLSYKEIAHVLDLTVSNVGVIIHTGLKVLRERLNPASSTPAPAAESNPATGGSA